MNPTFPPPLEVSVDARDALSEGVWGCSIAYMAKQMEAHEYVAVQLDYTDAFFVRRDLANSIKGLPSSTSLYSLYAAGYLLRPERLRCLGLHRYHLNYQEADAWNRFKHVKDVKKAVKSYVSSVKQLRASALEGSEELRARVSTGQRKNNSAQL